MSNSDQPAIATDKRKPWLQFSIAFLLGLTAACAFVLGIATWIPSLSVFAAAIPAIIAWAYRRGRRAFRFSIIGGAAMTGVVYADWLAHDEDYRHLREKPLRVCSGFSCLPSLSPSRTGHCGFGRQRRKNEHSQEFRTADIAGVAG